MAAMSAGKGKKKVTAGIAWLGTAEQPAASCTETGGVFSGAQTGPFVTLSSRPMHRRNGRRES